MKPNTDVKSHLFAPASWRRRGLGIPLLTVLAVVLSLLLLGLSLGFRGQGVTASVQRSVFQDDASNLAWSAASEAVHRLRKEANQEGTASFHLLRTEGTAVMTMEVDQLPHTERELDQDKRYRLDGGVTVRVLRRAAASRISEEIVPFECLGVLRVRARVLGPRGLAGSSEADYGYRVVLASAPRPFDLPTFMLLDPQELLTRDAYGGDANVAIQTSVDRIAAFRKAFGELVTAFEETARSLQQQLDQGTSDPSQLQEALGLIRDLIQQFREGSRPPTWPARPWVARDPDTPTEENLDELHLFQSALVVYSLAEEIELDRLNLPGRIRPHVLYLKQDEADLEDLGKRFQASLRASPPDPNGSHSLGLEYRRRVIEHVRHLDAMLQVYKDFQDLLAETSGAPRLNLLARYRRTGLSEQVWKTPYLFQGEGAVDRATKFLADHPQGLVVVDPPEGATETLVVRLENYEGRLVLASSAPVQLDQVRVQNPGRDAVIIQAYRGLRVSGPVQAGLVALSGEYQASGNSFTGALLLDHLSERSALDEIFRGSLRRQESLSSGPPGGTEDRPPPSPEKLVAVLGPEPVHRLVDL